MTHNFNDFVDYVTWHVHLVWTLFSTENQQLEQVALYFMYVLVIITLSKNSDRFCTGGAIELLHDQHSWH